MSKRHDEYVEQNLDIKGIFTEEDFNNEKEEINQALYKSFKKIRVRFTLTFLVFITAFSYTFYSIYFLNAIFDHTMLVFVMCVVLVISGSFLVVQYKDFQKERQRYNFRIRSLCEKITNHNMFLTVSEEEIKSTLSTADLKYGISLKALIVLILAVIIVFYGIIPAVNRQKLKFTPEKWQSFENRIDEKGSLIQAISKSTENSAPDKSTKCDFSDGSIETFISLLGEPELKTNISRGHKEEIKGESYIHEIGEPVGIAYDSKTFDSSEVTVLQYYCGKTERGLKIWFVIVFIDNQYKGNQTFIQDKVGFYDECKLAEYFEGSTDNASR